MSLAGEAAKELGQPGGLTLSAGAVHAERDYWPADLQHLCLSSHGPEVDIGECNRHRGARRDYEVDMNFEAGKR